jgi:hypothetical protein
MASTQEVLASRQINKIMATLETKLEASQQLAFLNRTPIVNAEEEELTAKFDGTTFAADIVTDDERAVTYEFGKLTTSENNVPNLKIGIRLTQAQLRMHKRLEKRFNGVQDEGYATDWWNIRVAALKRGIDLRSEALILAAKLDSVVYDRLGVKFTGSFGTPAGLKVTPVTLWSNAGSATPITDLQQMRFNAEDAYGRTYNRATMSTADFMRASSTTEFQNKAALQFKYTPQPNTISPYDASTRDLFEAISGFKIELYNVTYKTKSPAGAVSRIRTLPLGKVLLTNSDDDNSEDVFDLANGVVTESIVAELVPTMVQGLAGEQFGPAAYVAPTSLDLNPPGVASWAVARRFPRKHDETECAVLTVI